MKSIKLQLLALVALLFAANPAFAASYGVTIDTSSLAGTSGYLYLQLVNGANIDTFSATAQLLDFSTDGTMGATTDGAYTNSNKYATGTLPGELTIANTNAVLNDYNQAITFGNSISFTLVLDTLGAPDPMSSATFSFWLSQDAAGAIPLLTADGLLFTVDVNGNGVAGMPNVLASQVNVVPVPAAALLFAPGLLGLVAFKRKLAA